MCGITGWVDFSQDLTQEGVLLDAMTQTMASLVNVSRVMVEAINQIRTNYQNADAAAVDELLRARAAAAHELAPEIFSTGLDG